MIQEWVNCLSAATAEILTHSENVGASSKSKLLNRGFGKLAMDSKIPRLSHERYARSRSTGVFRDSLAKWPWPFRKKKQKQTQVQDYLKLDNRSGLNLFTSTTLTETISPNLQIWGKSSLIPTCWEKKWWNFPKKKTTMIKTLAGP